jgi:hypothetical protein
MAAAHKLAAEVTPLPANRCHRSEMAALPLLLLLLLLCCCGCVCLSRQYQQQPSYHLCFHAQLPLHLLGLFRTLLLQALI